MVIVWPGGAKKLVLWLISSGGFTEREEQSRKPEEEEEEVMLLVGDGASTCCGYRCHSRVFGYMHCGPWIRFSPWRREAVIILLISDVRGKYVADLTSLDLWTLNFAP